MTTRVEPQPFQIPLVEVDDIDPYYTGPTFDGQTITLDFIEHLIKHFKAENVLHERYAQKILLQTRELLIQLPSLVDITVPDGKHITVCGDIHGQFYDLINIFDKNGYPSEDNPYLFNGDFVDRGSYSVEVILTLFAYKCLYPNAVFLARGNHETRSLNEFCGFYPEVTSKFNDTFTGLFGHVFCCLPLAHVINKKVFVVHGGLFRSDGVKLSDIRAIDRFREPVEEGLMSELLWSDPYDGLGRCESERGKMGVRFGSDVTNKFLEDNGLDLIVRSHESKHEGYEYQHDDKLITVFSAPNYCNDEGNEGAFLRFVAPEMNCDPIRFKHVPNPEMLLDEEIEDDS